MNFVHVGSDELNAITESWDMGLTEKCTRPQFAGRRRCFAAELKHRFVSIFRNSEGAIAVEMALITPVVLGSMLVAAQLGFQVFKHQKVYSASYAGASYLQDQMSQGEYSKLREQKDENGRWKDSDMVRITKLVIKDASGLPLDLEKIKVEARCGCPVDGDESEGEAGDGDGDAPNSDKPKQDRNLYYASFPIYGGSNTDVCKFNCSNGTEAKILAQIDVAYTSKSLWGPDEEVTERLVTRLR